MHSAPIPTKTLLFVDGRKGGPGKSMTAMALLEYLQTRKDVRSYDFEGDTGDLAIRYGATPILPDPMGRLGGFSGVLDTLMSPSAGVNLAVVDVGAPAGDRIEAFLDELGAADLARAGQLQICFLWVCGRHRRSFLALDSAMRHWSERGIPFKLSLVVNEGLTQEFSLIERSPAVQKILAQNVQLARLPALEVESAMEAEAINASFGAYIDMQDFQGAPISFSRRMAVRAWLQKCQASFRQISFLGDLVRLAPGEEVLA